MYSLASSLQYRKQFKKIIKNNKKVFSRINTVINILISGQKLEKKYCDHKLKGNKKKFRECHISPDLLLIYKKEEDKLVLHLFEIGSHSKLF